MKQVFGSLKGRYFHPMLQFPVLPNEAREIADLMKRLRPDWQFAVASESSDSWDYKV